MLFSVAVANGPIEYKVPGRTDRGDDLSRKPCGTVLREG